MSITWIKEIVKRGKNFPSISHPTKRVCFQLSIGLSKVHMRSEHNQCACENIFRCFYHKRVRQGLKVFLRTCRYVTIVNKVGFMSSWSVKVFKILGIVQVGLKGNIKLSFGPESLLKDYIILFL